MLLLAVVLVTGAAANVVSAGSLPPCRMADVLTAERSYSDWQTTLLDTTYKLTPGYVPPGLHSTAEAGLNGGQRVRGFMIADLRAMATSARTAGARLAVQSAYRSYSTQAATFSYWVRVSGYTPRRSSRARVLGIASTSSAPRSTSGVTAARRPGTTRIGARLAPGPGFATTPGGTAS